MTDLWHLRELLGPEAAILGVALGVSVLLWVGLIAGSLARFRIPAPLWWLPPAAVVAVGAVVGHASAAPLVDALVAADALAIRDQADVARGTLLAPRALAWLAASLWCAVSALALSLITALRLEHPTSDWVSGMLPLGTGSVACALAAAFGASLQASIPAIFTLIGVAIVAVVAVGSTALRSSLSRTERSRIGASRALVVSFGLGAVIAIGMFWRDALAALDADGSHGILPTTTAFALAIAASGLPTLGTARGALGTLRGVLSGGFTLALLGTLAAILWVSRPPEKVLEASRGGAISRLPDALWTRLPRAVDLAEHEEPVDPIDGSCLVSEAAQGWEAEPLFAAISPEAHVARNVTNPDAVHELDRSPGCPAFRAPLDGPLAASEIAVVALDGRRAAAALAGWEWFRDRGSLRVLVQPDPIQTATWTDAAVRAQASSIPFLWERPPAVRPPDDFEPGTWDEAWAASLPVTLLEGPYPVLVAGGMRSRLPASEMGIETLQLALTAQPPHRRDLVLVPRKEWSVQDLVGFCLAVHGVVPGARCVIRPETPARWSLRTQLPLPW